MTLTETTLMNGGPDFEVVVMPDLGALAPIRREVARRLDAHGVATARVDDALLVVCELCSNAIDATTPGDAPIQIRVRLSDTAVIVEVDNAGQSFDDAAMAHGQAGAEGGRGLVIVRALTDDVSVRFHDGRCVVRAFMSLG